MKNIILNVITLNAFENFFFCRFMGEKFELVNLINREKPCNIRQPVELNEFVILPEVPSLNIHS